MNTRANLRKKLGQGMTEYIIIVALIAVASIAVYQLFGKTIRNQTAGITQELAGKDGTTAIAEAGAAAKKAEDDAKVTKTLATYDKQHTNGSN